MDFVKDFKITKEEGSQVKIEGEIPYTELEKEREKALKHLGANIAVDGFRKGHVPEKVVIDKVGEVNLLTEMAERALARVYPEAIKAHELQVIGHPAIQITKIAKDNPLGFIATAPVMPEITLPDYKAVAKKANADKASAEVTDEEVEEQAQDIVRQKEAYEKLQKKAAAKADEGEKKDGEELGDVTELPTPESEAEKADEEAEEKLPELTDDYVKTLGQPGQFESVADFKAKLREHLEIQKKQEAEAAHRAKITDAIIDETKLELPQLLIDSEINQMFAQMEDDLKRANLKMDDYLGHIKKTKEDLITEWTPAAEKRAKLQLVLNEIAKAENVEADKAAVDQQVDQLLEQYKDADRARVQIYVESVLTNEAVMKLLEEQ